MKNIVSFLLILLAFDISANAQNVDLSSVDEFLNITALLKNGEEVNMEQWNQFDSSAAYSAQGGLSVAGRCRCLTKDSNTSIEKEGYIPYSLQA